MEILKYNNTDSSISDLLLETISVNFNDENEKKLFFSKHINIRSTEQLIRLSLHLRGKFLLPILMELSERAAKEESSVIGKWLPEIASIACEEYNSDAWNCLYDLLYKICSLSNDAKLKKIIIAYLITRLQYQNSAKVIEILSSSPQSLDHVKNTIFISNTANDFIGKTLNASDQIKLLSFLHLGNKKKHRAWQDVKQIISDIDLKAGATSAADLAGIFLSLNSPPAKKKFVRHLVEKQISFSNIINDTNPNSRLMTPAHIMDFLVNMYYNTEGKEKDCIIRWMGETKIRPIIMFLMHIFESSSETSDSIIDSIADNADIITSERIIAYYKEDPKRASLILKRLTFNIDSIKNELCARYEKEGISQDDLWLIINLFYNSYLIKTEEKKNRDLIYLTLKRCKDFLQKYKQRSLRIASLLVNIDNSDRKKAVLELLCNHDITSDDLIFSYIINTAGLSTIKRFTDNLINFSITNPEKININPQELIPETERVEKYSINDLNTRNQFYESLIHHLSRRDFDMHCNELRDYHIPDPPVKFKSILNNVIRHQHKSAGEIISDIFNISESAESCSGIITNILSGTILNKKNINKIKNILDDSISPVQLSTDTKKDAHPDKSPAYKKVFDIMLPALFEVIANEKKESARETLFQIFLLSFKKVNSQITKHLNKDIDYNDFIHKIIMPSVQNAENIIYSSSFNNLKERHKNLLSSLRPDKKTCIDFADRVSDLRTIYSMRKKLLAREINRNKSEKEIASKELSIINKLTRELFILEMFLEKICSYQSGNTKTTSELLITTAKDSYLSFRSYIGNDCNEKDLSQLSDKNSIFFRFYHKGIWKGYAGCVVMKGADKSTPDALLIDVVNIKNITIKADTILKLFISNLSIMCRENGIGYIISSGQIHNFSNKDFIRKAAKRYYGNSIQNNWLRPKANFQSFDAKKYNLIWADTEKN